jgi:peptidase M23-like protein
MAMRLLLAAAASFVAFLALAGPARAEWIWPLRGSVITTYRNGDDPYAGGQHRGIDIAGPVGARVVAAAGGEVRFAGTAGSSGLTVSVRTSDGFDTSYLHLSSVSVREGEFVSSGHALGAVGTTGSRSASEPHLHFGVREAGTPHAYRNPLDFLPPLQVPTPEAPRPGPSPAPAPTPPAPAPAPAGEHAPRRVPAGGRAPHRVPAGDRAPHRVPAGDRAPHRVPAGERVPRRVPAGGRSPRRVPAYERAPRGVPVGDRVPRRVPVGGRAPHHAPVGDLAPHMEPAGGRIRALRPAAGGVPLEGHASRRAPSGSELQWAVPEARSLGRIPEGSPPRQSQPGGLPDGARGPATAPGRSGGGPDVGWILACVGLLLAAALLGLTEDGRKASRTGRGYVVRLLRPLTGRAE